MALLIAAAVIAVLVLARQVLVPFTLAVLFAFLLSPLVNLLEKLRLPRAFAVSFVLIVSCSIIGGMAWIVTNQLVEVTNQLPRYKANITRKIKAIRPLPGGSFSRATTAVQDISNQLSIPIKPSSNPNQTLSSPPPPAPMPVEIVTSPPTAIRDLLGSLLGRLAGAIIVIVFTFFMLIKREDLRHRLLGLVGQNQIQAITKTLDDSAKRVGRYLRLQLITNLMLAVLVSSGLYWIGVPNALVWGVLAGLLRFIPYVGVWIGAAMPILLSIAIFDGWVHSLEVFGLFAVLEFLIANFFEPWFYGEHTGISSLAILVAAVFWTTMWGPIGLLLSTPLTVCLVVLGHHIPNLEFLSVLLGNEPPAASPKHSSKP